MALNKIYLLAIRGVKTNEVFAFESKEARDDTAHELADQFPLLEMATSEAPINKYPAKLRRKSGNKAKTNKKKPNSKNRKRNAR